MLEWHDCKTDPPKESGFYLLCDTCGSFKYLSHVLYTTTDNTWQGYCGYVIDTPYKWAEVELPE